MRNGYDAAVSDGAAHDFDEGNPRPRPRHRADVRAADCGRVVVAGAHQVAIECRLAVRKQAGRGNFDADALKNGILPKYGPIDTSEGQRLAIEGAARRIDLQNRAVQKYLPR